MNTPSGLPQWLKIVLPLVIAVGFGLSPRPAVLTEALTGLAAQEHDEEMIETVLAFEPWRTDALENLALARYRAGDYQAVIFTLSQAESRGQLSLEGARLLASANDELGLPRDALSAYLAVLSLEPEIRDHYLVVSRLAMDLGEFQTALETLENMLAVFPGDAEGLYRLGLVEFALSLDNAVTTMKLAAQQDQAYQNTREILEEAEKLAGRSSDPAHRLLMRGRALGAADEWKMSQVLFERVVELDPGYAEGWAFLGEARQQTGAGGGREQLEKAAELDSDSQTVRGLTALFHRRRGEYDQALALISLAARSEPALASWQIEWANTLVEKGDLEEALTHYRKALDLEPDNLDTHYLLGQFCVNYDMELRETGLPAAREGAVKQARDPRWQDLLGRIFWRLGDGDLAERSYRRALAIDPGFPAANLHLGQYYLDRGDNMAAYSFIKNAASQEIDSAIQEMAARLLEQFFGLVPPAS